MVVVIRTQNVYIFVVAKKLHEISYILFFTTQWSKAQLALQTLKGGVANISVAGKLLFLYNIYVL